MSDGRKYSVKLTINGAPTLMDLLFEEQTENHRELFADSQFQDSMRTACFAFRDPGVAEVPVFEPGKLQPAAYLRRTVA